MPAFGKQMTLKSVTGGCPRLPTRMVLYAHEKWGKSSISAFAPRPLFLMTRGETGLLTLIQSGQLGRTNHFAEPAEDWSDVMQAVRVLTEEDHNHGTFVLDTVNGAERLCMEQVCRDSFEGNWQHFDAYGRGVNIAQSEWLKLIDALDGLRMHRKMAVILLAHAKVQTFKNPSGNDYDRYQPDMAKQTWGLTHKWADVIAFGSFQVKEMQTGDKNKVKASGGQQRVLHLERSAAWDAGNRYGLPAMLPCGASPKAAWDAFAKAVGATLARGAAAEEKATNGSGHAPEAKPAAAPAVNPDADDVPDPEPTEAELAALNAE